MCEQLAVTPTLSSGGSNILPDCLACRFPQPQLDLLMLITAARDRRKEGLCQEHNDAVLQLVYRMYLMQHEGD